MKFTMWRRHRDVLPEEPSKVVANSAIWQRLKVPIRWYPQVGEVLIGSFVGYREHNGMYGSYRTVMVRADDMKMYSISGGMIVDLLAAVQRGTRVRIVYGGTSETLNGFMRKKFEAFTYAGSEYGEATA